jgi:hypothetical protein
MTQVGKADFAPTWPMPHPGTRSVAFANRHPGCLIDAHVDETSLLRCAVTKQGMLRLLKD